MSRKQRVVKRTARQEQQRRLLLIGGAAAVVVVIIGALIVYSANRDAQQAAIAASTATAIAARSTQMPQWDEPPAMSLDPNKDYRATLVTAKGNIVVDLFEDQAPITVNNFVFLARQGFYDNTTFHRVIDGFMAQGGDPTGTGTGGPGYTIADETNNGLTFDEPGLLAMANTGSPNSGGSQFFITYVEVPRLNGGYTIFGRVLEGLDVAESLTRRDPQQNPNFFGDALVTVEISEVDKGG